MKAAKEWRFGLGGEQAYICRFMIRPFPFDIGFGLKEIARVPIPTKAKLRI